MGGEDEEVKQDFEFIYSTARLAWSLGVTKAQQGVPQALDALSFQQPPASTAISEPRGAQSGLAGADNNALDVNTR